MRMPTLLTLPPSRFLLRLVSIDLLTLTLALGMGFVLHGDPSAYTGEGEPVTWLSFAHLLASGGLANVVFRLRTHGRPPLCGWRDSRWFWLLIAGLAVVALIREAWLRSTVPFMEQYLPKVFVPGVGRMLPPDTEIRWTNGLDFWTVSRTNRLGFPDREPPSPERAAKGCHSTVIGDSFVEASEVPIPQKFHVRLEEMAAREFPHLDVTTSAFGRGGTG